MRTINPVQVVSDFLKSVEGTAMMASIGETDRHVEIGAVDGVLIVLGKQGFKARGDGREEPAIAYDVFDAVMAGQSAQQEKDKTRETFLCSLKERIAETQS